MKRILITGGRGFLGRNLAAHLRARLDCQTLVFDHEDTLADLQSLLNVADVIFHLAGVNRPKDPIEFEHGNSEFTEQLCRLLTEGRRVPKIVFASSVQADLDNPYGRSKRKAELALRTFEVTTGAVVRIYRLNNLFGKWCRPNYNSVTATFCHNIANDLPITISNPANEVELSYVDDVVAAFISELENGVSEPAPIRSLQIRLDDLAGRIQAFHEIGKTLKAPDFADWFNRALYATCLSYTPPAARLHNLQVKADARGGLAEFLKSEHFGQIFVSRTQPGVIRGNHYHHTKTEKFFVVEGDGLIRMRAIEGGQVQEYAVRGRNYQVVDIPPGFSHSITNVGISEMVTLFWSSEVFDPDRPDTYYLPVDGDFQDSSDQKGAAADRRGAVVSRENR
jgi:UDP-2-acetamido-2,6-beta-L-arabino-hexul-4-ose reductase